MAKRYVPRGPFVAIDNKGRRRHFNPDHHHQDGTVGYEKSDLNGLSKEQKASFRLVEVTGRGVIETAADEEVVEQATAEPGVKRTTRTRKAATTEGTTDDEETTPEPDAG